MVCHRRTSIPVYACSCIQALDTYFKCGAYMCGGTETLSESVSIILDMPTSQLQTLLSQTLILHPPPYIHLQVIPRSNTQDVEDLQHSSANMHVAAGT